MFEGLNIKKNNEIVKSVSFVVDTIKESGSYVYMSFESGKDANDAMLVGAFDKDLNKKVAALKIIYNILTGAKNKNSGKLIIDGAAQVNVFIGESVKATYYNALFDAKDQAHCDATFKNLYDPNASEDVNRYSTIYQLMANEVVRLQQNGITINVVSLFDIYYANAEVADASKYVWKSDGHKKFPKETTTVKMFSFGKDGSKSEDGNVTTKVGGFGKEGTDVILTREKVVVKVVETYKYVLEKKYYCAGTKSLVTPQQTVKLFNEHKRRCQKAGYGIENAAYSRHGRVVFQIC